MILYDDDILHGQQRCEGIGNGRRTSAFGLYNERVGGVLDMVSFLTLAAKFLTC